MHSHGLEDKIARIERNKDWLPIGAAITPMINEWAGSSDLVMYIGLDGAKALEDAGAMSQTATAFYEQRERYIEVSAPFALGPGCTPGMLDVNTIGTRSGLSDHPILGGVLMHESMHAKHSTYSFEDFRKDLVAKYGHNRGNQLIKILVWLEETRIESKGVAEWPKDAGFLRASSRRLTEDAGRAKIEEDQQLNIVSAILMVLMRETAGVLKPKDVVRLKRAIVKQISQDVLDKITAEVKVFHKQTDTNVPGREAMMVATKAVYDLLAPFMPKVSMPSDGSAESEENAKQNTPSESEQSQGSGQEQGEDSESGSGEGDSEDGEDGEGQDGSGSGDGEDGEQSQSGQQGGSGGAGEPKDGNDHVPSPDGKAGQAAPGKGQPGGEPGQMVPGTENNGDLSDESAQAAQDTLSQGQFGGAEDVWTEENRRKQEARNKEVERQAKDQKKNDEVSHNTFERSSGSNGRTKSKAVERRPPTDKERRALVIFTGALQNAKWRDRKVAVTKDIVPPGRLITSAALRDEAVRWAGGASGQIDMFKGKRRTHVDDPDLTVGIIKDISGSMSGTMEPMAVADWIMANSVNRIEGAKCASLCFGESVFPTLWPGQRLDMVTRYDATDGFEEFDQAFRAIDGKLKLLKGSGVRLLVVTSDGNYRPHEERACRQWLAECKNAGVGVLWLGLKSGRAEEYIKDMGPGGEFVHIGNGVTEAIGPISQAALKALRGY